MLSYALRRTVWMLVTMLIVSVITFYGLNFLPGDTATLYLGDDATPEAVAAFREAHQLNRSIMVRYVDWLGGMLTGRPGDSLQSGRPIMDEIARRLPVTLHVLAFGLFFTAFFGITFGTLSALGQNTRLDYGVRLLAVFTDSFPNFFLLTMLLLFPAILWGYGPPLGYAGPIWEHPIRDLRQFVPPTIILGLGSAFLMRITRSSLLEVIRADYVRTARAKGLGDWTIITRHVLRNAMIPVITVLGGVVVTLINGTVILENVMTLPGLGQYAFQAVQMRDFNVVQAMTLYAALTVMVSHLLVDLSYTYIDPRIRYS